MSEKLNPNFLLTNPVTGAYLSLLEPRKFKGKDGKESGEPKYGATFIFAADNPDLNGIKKLAMAVAKAEWPNRDIISDLKSRQFKFPFGSGDAQIQKAKKKASDKGNEYDGKLDFLADKTTLKSSSKYQPQLAIFENGKILDLEGELIKVHGRKFYSGTLCLGEINFKSYNGVGENPDGVTAYLQSFVSFNRGDRLGGGTSTAEKFKGYAGKISDIDPTDGADLDDDIPF
jgi:hypothetical protein